MKARFVIFTILHTLIISFLANSFLLIRQQPNILYALIPVFLLTCVFAGTSCAATKRAKVCFHGTVLLYAFCAGVVLSAIYHILLAVQTIPGNHMTFIWSLVQCVGVLFVVFWVGILCVYLCSSQLGLRLRLLGLICGMIPIANLVMLYFILKSTTAECLFEISHDLPRFGSVAGCPDIGFCIFSADWRASPVYPPADLPDGPGCRGGAVWGTG